MTAVDLWKLKLSCHVWQRMMHTRDWGSGAGALLCHMLESHGCVKWILDGCIMHAWHMASREHIRLHIILLYYRLHASVCVHLHTRSQRGLGGRSQTLLLV